MKEAFFRTSKELAQGSFKDLPEEFVSSNHLIYSSPATLAFNSPGAQGFGVKEPVLQFRIQSCCLWHPAAAAEIPRH